MSTPGDTDTEIHCYHEGTDSTVPRRCPHQGADLKDGWISEGKIVCPWHGCRIGMKATS